MYDYVAIYQNKPLKHNYFVLVGWREFFPEREAEFLMPIDLKGKNLREVYDEFENEIGGGSLACYPNCVIPSERWRAISIATRETSIGSLVKSVKDHFEKYIPLEELVTN